MTKVEFGVDQLLKNMPPDLRRARVGMVTSNVATLAATAEASRTALRKAGVNLVRLFGPEHGLAGTAADGDRVSDNIDPATNLPVISLYGDHVRPTDESLADIDCLIYDIPDVGARFYTYIWTLSHVMEAAAANDKPLYVLDRPNPLGGDLEAAEGPILDEQLSSFVGRWNIPVRYSLTIGELAQLWNAERKIGCDLRVIKMNHWRRDMHWPATNLKFVRLSPAMPSYETALVYPGACLIEGTKLSEGRGTDAPFQLVGAPWVNSSALAAALAHPTVDIQPTTFIPEGRKYAGEKCNGLKITVTDANSFRPVAFGLHLIAQLIRLHPTDFEWLPYPTAASGAGHQHFDRLIGRADIRADLERGADLSAKIANWTDPTDWSRRVGPFLIYA